LSSLNSEGRQQASEPNALLLRVFGWKSSEIWLSNQKGQPP